MSWEIALYWALAFLAGLALVDLLPLDWRLMERLAAGLLVGVVASSLLSLGLALWLGMGPGAALAAPAILLLLGGMAGLPLWRRRLGAQRTLWLERQLARWETAGERAGLLVALALGAGFYFLFTRAVQPEAGQLLANYPTVWADWSAHASYAQNLLLGHNLPPTDVLESGAALRYPFLPDFQSALLGTLGQNVLGAMDVGSWLISWAAAVLIWQLAWRVTRRPVAAALALCLALLGGGLGFVGLYGDGCQQLAHAQATFQASACTHLGPQTPGAVAGFLRHLPTELTHLPRSYDGQSQTDPPLPDLEWYEPLLAYWLPQRDFDYGVGLVALLSLLLWEASRGRRRELALGAGVLGAALPWFNPFGYMAVGLIGLWWLGRRGWWGRLGLYLLPLLLLGLPRMLFVVLGPHGQLVSPAGSNLFPQLDVGWLAHAAVSCTQAQFRAGAVCDALYLSGANPATVLVFLAQSLADARVWGGTAGFWLANTGVFCLLALGCLGLALTQGRLGRRLRRLELLRFCAPFWILFLVANLVVTQPWNWDNTKLLAYWYLGAAIPVAWVITHLFGRGLWRILGGALFTSLILSGMLSLGMALGGQSNLAGQGRQSLAAPIAGPEEEQVAQVVRQETSPRAVFLTEGQPNEPVTALAGRPLVLGYYGWLWSYGQPLRRRLAAVQAMYAGCPSRGGCHLGRLLRTYHVSYIEFEREDYNDIRTNVDWYRAQHLPVLVQNQDYLILDVRRLWARS